MQDFTALAIVAKQAAIYVLSDGGPVVVDVERRIGTELSDKQARDMDALLDTFRHELGVAGTDAELHEALQIITDRAYQAKERIEVDAL